MSKVLRNICKVGLVLVISLVAEGTLNEALGANRQAKVISCSGDSDIFKTGKAEPVECRLNMTLKTGDRIKTSEDGHVAIAFIPAEGNIVKIREKSDVVLDLRGKDDEIKLVDGEVVTLLEHLESGRTFEVITPSAVCGARGTGWLTRSTVKMTEVVSFESRVAVMGLGADGKVLDGAIILNEGYKTKVKKGKAPSQPEKVKPAVISELVEEMYMLLNVRKGRLEDARGVAHDEKRMTAMESRMERVERRLERGAPGAAQPMPVFKSLSSGRDDDRNRRKKP